MKVILKNSQIINIDKKSILKFSIVNNSIKLEVNRNKLFSDEFILAPQKDDFNIINGKKYKGNFIISRERNKLFLINSLYLEDYVKGVMLKEIPKGNNNVNNEAIKAMAVVIRTYALNKINESKILFDTFNDVRDQVYGGASYEDEQINKLVDLTKGKTLFYREELAKVFYHSTCGGKTENIENVFSSEPFPYLKSIQDGDINCKISPKFQWKESFSESLIIKRLKESNYVSGSNLSLKEINILSRFSSGRVKELEIVLLENNRLKRISIHSNKIRFVLKNFKGEILPSTNFQIEIKNGMYEFIGKGYGHGVGLCQWGAINLSRSGWNYKDILYFYFPKTEIMKAYD
ncbi:MAG: SpoIID/LytB domain-containing protein [Ignavibacterium sp.]|nr:SpoIID/LytB domain-containing protein [Ignavibacterium sp.]